MIVKMDDMHDILNVVESDMQHTDVVPIEENDKIKSETIDGMCEFLGGGLEVKKMKELCMEYEGENSFLEAMIINNFNNK